jgi:hypothetical protein
MFIIFLNVVLFKKNTCKERKIHVKEWIDIHLNFLTWVSQKRYNDSTWLK